MDLFLHFKLQFPIIILSTFFFNTYFVLGPKIQGDSIQHRGKEDILISSHAINPFEDKFASFCNF